MTAMAVEPAVAMNVPIFLNENLLSKSVSGRTNNTSHGNISSRLIRHSLAAQLLAIVE